MGPGLCSASVDGDRCAAQGPRAVFRRRGLFRSAGIPVEVYLPLRCESALDDLASKVLVGNLAYREFEQLLLDSEAHEAMGDIDADQTRMAGLAAHQGSEVGRVVCYEYVVIMNCALSEFPIRLGLQTEPVDVGGLREAEIACRNREVGAETLVDQKFHRGGGKSSRVVVTDTVGCCRRHSGVLRGRPRRG